MALLPGNGRGRGRREADANVERYLRADPRVPGMTTATRMIFQAFPGELTIEDVLANEVRRVGAPCDHKEWHSRDPTTSDCKRCAILIESGRDERGLAAARMRAMGFELEANDQIPLEYFELTLSSAARDHEEDLAGLRIGDQQDNEKVVSLTELQGAGQQPGSREWEALGETLKEFGVGNVLRHGDARDSVAVVVWLHPLAALVEAGLVQAHRHSLMISRREIDHYHELREGPVEQPYGLEMATQKFVSRWRKVNDYLAEIVEQAKRTLELLTFPVKVMRRVMTVIGTAVIGLTVGRVAGLIDPLAWKPFNDLIHAIF